MNSMSMRPFWSTPVGLARRAETADRGVSQYCFITGVICHSCETSLRAYQRRSVTASTPVTEPRAPAREMTKRPAALCQPPSMLVPCINRLPRLSTASGIRSIAFAAAAGLDRRGRARAP